MGTDTELTLDVSQKTSQFLSLDGSDLILNQDLDKEGLAGPTSFSTNVLCKRVGGDEPGRNDDHPLFSIPVHIHVTDVNDNVPQWVNGAPYKLNISELTLVGTRIIDNIKAVDLDQPGKDRPAMLLLRCRAVQSLVLETMYSTTLCRIDVLHHLVYLFRSFLDSGILGVPWPEVLGLCCLREPVGRVTGVDQSSRLRDHEELPG